MANLTFILIFLIIAILSKITEIWYLRKIKDSVYYVTPSNSSLENIFKLISTYAFLVTIVLLILSLTHL